MSDLSPHLPPRQQLAALAKWPVVGERMAEAPAGPWRVTVCGAVARPLDITIDELRSLAAVERAVDIHCVTRWSKLGVRFMGVRLAELLTAAEPREDARFASFRAYSARDHSTSLPLADALALETLVVWQCEAKPLAPEHGGPVRVVVPGRYFYKSVKWLRAIELLAADRLGYWEREAGYHNVADPWREQRYMAPAISRQEMQAALVGRNFSARDLRSLDARFHDLAGLNARGALLRDADFRDCRLSGVAFDDANLSNARFERAILTGASFVRADVEGADFTGADLRGADFSGASLFGATFFAAESASSIQDAVIDRRTKIPSAALECLVPSQAEFVARLLADADA
jgi:DMSO/TMAO reductase YedYZ molybdopterin-dependent catalytic subunit